MRCIHGGDPITCKVCNRPKKEVVFRKFYIGYIILHDDLNKTKYNEIYQISIGYSQNSNQKVI